MAAIPSAATRTSNQNSSEKPKSKPGDEIEEIFRLAKEEKKKRKGSSTVESSDLKKKKTTTKKTSSETPKGSGSNKKKKDKKVDEGSEGKKKRRRTNDGLAIYSAEELGFAKAEAGGTPLCPFDCSCCF